MGIFGKGKLGSMKSNHPRCWFQWTKALGGVSVALMILLAGCGGSATPVATGAQTQTITSSPTAQVVPVAAKGPDGKFLNNMKSELEEDSNSS